MEPSENCYNLIRSKEGLSLKAYPDPGTGGAPWTIGYGHTGPEVHPGMVITQEQADELLRMDAERVSQQVQQLVTAPLNQNEFDALVCFVYNVGIGNFAKSTLLRKLNAGDLDGAANEFDRWTRGGGHVLPGLVARRHDEKELFCAAV